MRGARHSHVEVGTRREARGHYGGDLLAPLPTAGVCAMPAVQFAYVFGTDDKTKKVIQYVKFFLTSCGLYGRLSPTDGPRTRPPEIR